MNLIQQNRYDQLLRRVGDLKGGGSKLTEILGELFPMIDVENVPGELLRLMGTDICQGAGFRTAAAGEAPRVQLFNPFSSGKLVTLTTLIVSVDAVSDIRIATTIIPLTTGIGTETFRDRRQLITNRPSGQIRTDSTVALADANLRWHDETLSPVILTDPNGLAVLSPGSGYEVGTTTRGPGIAVSFIWRERVAEPSELSF